nr:unnamed protein product [Digitaria exilis]
MDERIPPPPFFHHSPSGVHSSPHRHNNSMWSSSSDRERYLAELLAERQKLAPFVQVLPFCTRLLNQGVLLSPSMVWNEAPGVVGSPVVKKVVRIDIPVDKYPNEDKLRDKPGYEHLNDPLHVLVEAEFSADIVDARLNQAVAILEDLLKPVDESMDYYKKQQLRELAILNGTLREESPSSHLSPSVSPFNSTGMKRAKTGR